MNNSANNTISTINNVKIITYTQEDMPYNKKEILRYSQSNDNDQVLHLIDSCIDEIGTKLTYKVCYKESTIIPNKEFLDFDFIKISSKDLFKNMKECHQCIIFASTIGIEIDRLINKYSKLQPSKALILQAIGAERIECLCNKFNQDIKNIYLQKNMLTRPRFSPGYGDLSINVQKDIFDYLNCSKHIGIMLNNSLSMSPTKSVTAFIGLYNERN